MRLTRRRLVLTTAAACVAACAVWALSARRETTLRCDLEGDGRAERLVLAPARDPSLSVWHGKQQLWAGIPKKWKPWKLATADVDGGGTQEIVLGVHKSTRFFPTPHNCLFVYGWDGNLAFPKWLGSSLGRPFTDFGFADVDDDEAEELVAVERTRDGKQCLSIYSWCGFGFEFDGELGPWREVHLRVAANGRLEARAEGREVELTVKPEMR